MADPSHPLPPTDAPVKTKRARKTPSKFADFVGGDICDPAAAATAPPKPPIRTFARKSGAGSAAGANASNATNSAAAAGKPLHGLLQFCSYF